MMMTKKKAKDILPFVTHTHDNGSASYSFGPGLLSSRFAAVSSTVIDCNSSPSPLPFSQLLLLFVSNPRRL